MKINKLLFVLILLTGLSCEKKEVEPSSTLKNLTSLNGESGLSLNESYLKWMELKKENGNSYIYQTRFISWAGYGSVTELKVENGVIVERNYEEYKEYWNSSQREIIDSYSETSNNLGSHEKGADLLTIDDLYNSCASEFLIADTTNNTLYFETDTTGLMTTCGFVPKDCVDDCFYGVTINSFNWI